MDYRDHRIDFDDTAEMPTVPHETTDIPSFGFPKDPEELKEHDIPFTGKNHETTDVPIFPKDPDENKESNSLNTQEIPVVKNSPKKPSKPAKKGTFKKNPKKLNVVMSVITIIMNILVTVMLFFTTRYAGIGKDLFLMINAGVLAVLLLIDILLIVMIRTRKIAVFIIDLLVVCLFLGVGGYGTYLLAEVNKSVDKVTTTNQDKEVSASLVIYSGTSGDPIVNIEDLEGRTVGVSTGSNTGTIAKKKLENENINVTYVDCTGFDDVLQKLIDGTIDCAVLSTNWKSQFETDEALSPYLEDMTVLSSFSDSVATEGVAGADKDITK
ncbi:MAG: ABC transporter substrate-binding protein, partial [Bulleidia sp.]